jgi:hypothetical protein
MTKTKARPPALTDDPEVQRAMSALLTACQNAATRAGDTLKTLAIVVHSEAGSDAGAIGCTCPACAGYILGSLGSALFTQLAERTGVSRLPATAEARH